VSDFLTNLATRTLCPATLAPRARLRFEPPGPEPLDLDLEDPAPRAVAARSTGADEIVRPATRPEADAAPRTEPAKRGAPVAQADLAAAAPHRPELPAASEIEAGPAAARLPPASPADGPPSTIESADEVRPGHDPHPKPAVDPVAANPAPRAVSLRRVMKPEPGEPGTAPSPRLPHRYEVQPPEVTRQATDRPDSRPPTSPREPARPVRRRPYGQPAPAASADGERGDHVVQVSIGRIEVRAVAPTAPPAAGRRGAPMTIEEYIAKRRDRR